jgi:hypothetical protein
MRRVGAVAVIALLCAPLAGCGRETRHDVSASIEQLGSIAAEGALMGDDLARNRTKTTYMRVHGEELSSQAEHEAEKLSDAPVDPDLHDEIDKAIELSSDIGGAIDDMRVSPNDHAQARKSVQDLRRWAGEAQSLAESVK